MFNNLVIDDVEYFNTIKQYKNVVCWGAGAKGRQTKLLLQQKGINVKYFIDSNNKKWGTIIDGIEVISYEKLKTLTEYCILITTVYGASKSIKEFLYKEHEKNPVYCCANPYKSETVFLTKEKVLNDKKAEETYKILKDEKSKDIFVGFINWKITGDHSYTTKYTEGNWMKVFSTDLIPQKEYTYFDIGAYTGDTILRFLAFSGGKYKKIIGFEPDPDNYKRCLDFIDNGDMQQDTISIKETGLWSKKQELVFYTAGDGEKYESSNYFVNTSTILPIDRKSKIETEKENEMKVKVDILDNYINEVEGKDVLIKLDVLSSEYEVLKGAEKMIAQFKPVILMEIGTRYDSTFDSILYLKKLNGSYEFYLRQILFNSNSRTFLIAR